MNHDNVPIRGIEYGNGMEWNFQEIFREKGGSVILLGLEYSLNPQHLMKVARAVFEKIKSQIKNLCIKSQSKLC